jgi:hypothetical protein
MALRKKPDDNPFIAIQDRIKELNDRVNILKRQSTPTVPFYDSTNWPANSVEGQVVVADKSSSTVNVLRMTAMEHLADWPEITWTIFPSHALPVYAEMEVYIPSSTLPIWTALDPSTSVEFANLFGGGNNTVVLYDDDSDGTYDSVSDLYTSNPVGISPLTGWHTIRWGNVGNGATGTIVVDGVSDTYTMGSTLGNAFQAQFGIRFDEGGVLYYGRLRVGTTLGGVDLLDYTPAIDGDPAAFGFDVTGDVALVPAPTNPPSAP